MSIGFILSKLPMSARIKARRNFIKYQSSGISRMKRKLTDQSVGGSLFGHLASLFVFDNTPEGSDYWFEVIRNNS